MTSATRTRGGLLLAFALLAAPAAFAQHTPTVFDDPALVQRYQSSITAQDLAAHLFIFASDGFEGRATGTKGQKLAATYLAGQYRRLGLTPKGTAETSGPYDPAQYYQPVPLYGQQLMGATLKVTGPSGTVIGESSFSPQQHDMMAYLSAGVIEDASAPIVFGGYGISDADAGYDDMAALTTAGIDLKESFLLMFEGEPMRGGMSLITNADTASTWTTQSNRKLISLFRGGSMPKGMLIVADDSPSAERTFAERARRAMQQAAQLNSLSLTEGGGRRGFQMPPIYTISVAMANRLLATSEQNVASLKAGISASGNPIVFALEGVEATSEIRRESVPVMSENVIAYLEGSDPVLKDEVVVVTSHYDHIGIDPLAPEADQINNGADDDGSGTVAVLEIAEAFAMAAKDGHGPRRSVVFLNVTGEERGLLGSAYYSDVEPIFALENTVTNLNIDMIGRRDPTYDGDQADNYVYIIGSSMISEELHDINLRANTVTGINMDLDERYNSQDDPNRFYARSDHWNFGKNGIPFIFYFNGTHEDYHGLDDEPEKIDYPQLAKRAQLIFATAWQVANQDARPAVSGEGFN